MHVASHFSSYVDFRSAGAFVFFKLKNVRPGNLNSWIRHCTQIIYACQYELNEMQGLTLARCTGSLQLCFCLDAPCTSPCYHLLGCAGLVLLASPSAFLTRRMVDQIRGIDLAIVPEDRYLQGYTGVQDVYEIP